MAGGIVPLGGTSANWMMEWKTKRVISCGCRNCNRPWWWCWRAANHTAEQAGIRAGMTLADAFAILPDLKTSEADIPAETKSLSRLADWCGRHTPGWRRTKKDPVPLLPVADRSG